MLRMGDTVKVIAATEEIYYSGKRQKEFIPIGTICTVVGKDRKDDGTYVYLIITEDMENGYWYNENELEFVE